MASNIDVGVGQHGTITNPTGKAGSDTQNPFTPVEHGRNSTTSAYTTVTSSDPLIPELVVGPIATGTLVGDTSTKGDGTETAVAVTGGAGYDATVTYTVTSSTASGLTIVDGGRGYMVGDTLTVVGDEGVTFTVATLS